MFLPANLRLILLSLFFMACGLALDAQQHGKPAIFPDGRIETYFRFILPKGAELKEISKIISIDCRKADTVYAYANPAEFGRFRQLNLPFERLVAPSLIRKPIMKSATKGLMVWDAYPTYDSYVQMMNNFAASYPNLCKLDTFGTTVNGRLLLSAHLTGKTSAHSFKPQVMYSSSIHGDETSGYVFMLELIDFLTGKYGTDPLATRLMDSLEIFINPLINPDGTFAGGNSTISGATRYNANGVDLNRNFPDPAGGAHPDGNAYQPETQAMMNLLDSNHVVLAANFHEGAEVVNYPWDTWQARHADDLWFQYISKMFADSAQHYGPAYYFTDITSDGYTDGWDWYSISGGLQDYHTYFMHGRHVTIEINRVKSPSASLLPEYWNALFPSFIHYLEQAMYGLHGTVTDSLTGKPLLAKIEIPSKDKDNSWVTSVDGAFCRFRDNDTCDVRITAPGYDTAIIHSVPITVLQQTRLDVRMHPVKGDSLPSHVQGSLRIYPNPFESCLNIEIPPYIAPVSVVIFDLSGRAWLSLDAKSSGLSINTDALPRGMYMAVVYAGKAPVLTQKLIKL